MHRHAAHVLVSALLLGGVLVTCPADGIPAAAGGAAVVRSEHPAAVAPRVAAPAPVTHVVPARRPATRHGMRARAVLPAPHGAIASLQKLLARLDYLPVRWSQRRHGFEWRWAYVPAALRRLFVPGVYGPLTRGAVVQFRHVSRVRPGAAPDASLLRSLERAWVERRTDPYPFTYVLVSQRRPERLRIWQRGRVVFSARVNTGEAPTTTAVGSFPVYLRLRTQRMRGIGPDGEPYDFPHVRWISYFHGGDAIHAFPRAAYGFPQSAGCVELPPSVAEAAWRTIHYGTVVTVLPQTLSAHADRSVWRRAAPAADRRASAGRAHGSERRVTEARASA